MRVHAIRTGTITIKAAIHDGRAYRLRHLPLAIASRAWEDIPVFAYVVEHPDGHIVVDTGIAHALETGWPWYARSFARVAVRADEEVGPAMRSLGLRPEDVRYVVPTHLHPDHGGGLAHFPAAEILVHRIEWEFAHRWYAKPLYRPSDWPAWLDPLVYDLTPEPYVSFASSYPVAPGVTLVPIPGHSLGQVAVAVRDDDRTLFFSGDHSVREQTFVRDVGRPPKGTVYAHYRLAIDTQRRIERFVREEATVLVPAHDHAAPERLRSRAAVSLDGGT